jgi:hypothetical protein
VELFKQIRREFEFGVGTIAGVSRKLGVHRRMVREALRSAEPEATRLRKPSHRTSYSPRHCPFAAGVIEPPGSIRE